MPRSFPTRTRTLAKGLALLTCSVALCAPPSQAAPVTAAKPKPSAAAATMPKLSIEAAKKHQFRPAVEGRMVEAADGAPSIKLRKMPVFDTKPKLNTTKFADALHAAFKDSTRGYSMQLRRNGTAEVTLIWEWAKSPTQGSKGWSVDTRMHVASVSKMLTGIIMVDLLDQKGLSIDTKIGPYLPGYWSVGPNVADITFRELLTHRSGFSTSGSDGSFPVMKSEVAAGVVAEADYEYENVNFSLCRVLGAVMAGSVPKNTVWGPDINDAMWDMGTTGWFQIRAQEDVFAKAGVANVSAVPGASNAFAYHSKSDTTGWNSGDVTTQLGGAGFRMSVSELTAVMGKYRRGGSIVAASKAKEGIEAMLGLDQAFDTPAGKIYNKNGGWGDADGNVEQSVVYFLPENMEVAVLVNSPIGAGAGASLRDTVRFAYLNSLE